ncbi:MAG: glutamine synthetase III [Bacteroidia bacterium]
MNARNNALHLIQQRTPRKAIDHSKRAAEIFAENVFDDEAMRHFLDKEVYKKLNKAIQHGGTIDREIAAPVASAMKAWALSKGASHFTHWFQPLTGLAAEKHDAFFELTDDGPIEKFGATELAQQEPDASSFPNGGLRSTFEARGYTAWDCSSPAFIFNNPYGKTLCIPTIFVAYTGEALGYKLPLLKSINMLDEAATAVAQLFDKKVKHVNCTLGAEQEYFLVDETYFNMRPDLVLTGRTVFGATPAKGQQLDDHYFGAIPERAFAFMNELEREAHSMGIPLKTRHNEVAPGQFECAPRFEELNVACDHGQLLMDLVDRTARRHNLRALLHEKPFAGINGSGKHNNWSLATDGGKNLLSPGSNPKENLMFLAFFCTVIKAMHEHADLMRASIASAGNDHRLGANEAPPAIISVFIGSQLSEVLDHIAQPPRKKRNSETNPYLELGIKKIPELLLDNTDRNRTSPFAFTGNKFEFRAVGSTANSAGPMTMLNLIVAEQLKDFKAKVDGKLKRSRKVEAAILDVVKEYIIDSKAIRFEGDGYSDEWVTEAESRGLSNIKKTPHALGSYLAPKAVKLFKSTGIFTEPEMHARYEVLIENYLNKVKIEADIIEELTMTTVLPVAMEYQAQLLSLIDNGKDAGLKKGALGAQTKIVERIGKHINAAYDGVEAMTKARAKATKKKDATEEAKSFAEAVLPHFDIIRDHVDALETLLPDAKWPLPKYREMLFVR